ncbi:hypothetical protein H311_01994 [Anncaliia algerae PRA109]|uniref:Uncharacterized protein n=1 Tax=Anncaliia algerae PRA339 TaxID=1288291 RepID=A0A059F0Z0_9MICR|nr:hypothetical protein H311_01994 [Anncaliia algerae PRA109]KCZ80626.1 hypothetical protein H312_01952 [Anncaliia algerae PRA339]
MQYKIIELLIQEDSFKLFTNPKLNPNLNTIIQKIPSFTSLMEFKNYLIDFFKQIIVNASDESLEYYESFKMINFVERIFNEIPKPEDSCLDMTDEIIALYTESLLDFIEGNDNETLRKYVYTLLS